MNNFPNSHNDQQFNQNSMNPCFDSHLERSAT